ncbi:MAG: NAD(P)H-hydrate dehydratase [Verrucomicrobia bacterium]|nr:NAD(P)H-hydrate dehydratase [Verrucomicrobiota bacterium]
MSDLILTAAEMREAEKRAFGQGIEAEALMDEAGERIANVILGYEPIPGLCVAYLGRGNNAGDAIVVANHLEEAGWEIWFRESTPTNELQPLPKKKISQTDVRSIPDPIQRLPGGGPHIILDGLLGVGSRAELEPRWSALTREINSLRFASNAQVYAIDIPTGVAETGIDPDAILANTTITVAFPKTALVRDDAPNHVGRIIVVDLSDLARFAPEKAKRPILSSPFNLRQLVPQRPFDSHKGDYGRVGIIAGSRGFVGASILCSEAAARGGAGLTTLYVPEDIYQIVASKAFPEVMVHPVEDLRSVLEQRLDSLAIGPGLGKQRAAEILDIVEKFPGPMVLDADGLNVLSHSINVLERCAGARLLTPHPGEMARLWDTKNKSRAEVVTEFTSELPVALLLKGSRTLIGENDKPLAYNSTGTPAQATGGSGDVLTGLCGALLGRRISPYDAARLGSWLCGRAAELATEDLSEESMLPSDQFAYFGDAFEELRRSS